MSTATRGMPPAPGAFWDGAEVPVRPPLAGPGRAATGAIRMNIATQAEYTAAALLCSYIGKHACS